MKLKWTKHCVLSANGNDKVNVDSNIFLLSKDLKDQFIGMTIIQKVRIKIRQMNKDIFLNQDLLESIDCLFQFIKMKMPILKDLKFEDIFYKEVKSKIVM